VAKAAAVFREISAASYKEKLRSNSGATWRTVMARNLTITEGRENWKTHRQNEARHGAASANRAAKGALLAKSSAPTRAHISLAL